MLHRHIHHNQFVVFSLYSLFLSLFLGMFVIEQIQTPFAFADEQYAPQTHVKDAKILIFGDMMLDRHVRQKINEKGAEYPFALIKNILLDNDIVVANAEGPFTFFNSVTLGIDDAPLNFTFDPALLPTL